MYRTAPRICFLLFGVVLPGLTPASGQPGPINVSVASVERREASETAEFVASVTPVRHAVIGSAVGGRVTEMPVEEGTRVTAGEPVAQLLTRTIELNLEAARAELTLREQELVELQNTPRPEERQQAEARMEAAESDEEYYQLRYNRVLTLYDQNAVTLEDLDAARSALQRAEALLVEARAGYELIQKEPREERLAQAEARVAMQKAVVEGLEDQISKHTIISRFDGFVVVKHTELGAWVQPGDPVVEIVALDEVDVIARVVEHSAAFIRPGSEITGIRIPAIPDQEFTGTVVGVIPQADMRSRTFPVHIRVTNTLVEGQPLIKAGMLARVVLPTGPPVQATLVPKDALVLGGPQTFVWVVDPDDSESAQGGGRVGPARRVPVEVGITSGSDIQVSGPIDTGHLVVVRGNERIRPGAPDQPPLVRWTE